MQIETSSGDAGSVAILGAHSAIGEALSSRAPGGVKRAIARRKSGHEFIIEDYGQATPEWFEGCDRVVQCVGISHGSRVELQRLNVDVPVNAAIAAKEAGVRRFVQISSFSVYGLVERVSDDTPIAPRSDYGRSKAQCDRELAALSDDLFAVQILRLPAIVGPGIPGKMASLVRLCRRLGRVVRPHNDVARSVISPALATSAIAQLGCEAGVYHAADVMPFSYDLLERAVADAAGEIGAPLMVPKIVTRGVRQFSPGAHWSLYRDCLLADSANLLGRSGGHSDIKASLGEIARRS